MEASDAEDRLPEDLQQQADETFDLLWKHVNAGKADGWDLVQGEEDTVFVSPDQAHRMWSLKTESSPVHMVRVEGVVECPPVALANFLWNQTLEQKQAKEDSILADHTLRSWGEHACVRYQRYHLPWPLSDRDVVALRCRRYHEASGTLLQWDVSLSEQRAADFQEPARGVVRAIVHMGAYAFRPIPDKPGQHVAVHVLHMDPAGHIPGFVVNWGEGKMRNRIRAFNDLIVEHQLGDVDPQQGLVSNPDLHHRPEQGGDASGTKKKKTRKRKKGKSQKGKGKS